MKPTCAVVTLALPFVASVISSHSDAQLLTASTPLLFRLAATEPVNQSSNRFPFKTVTKGTRSGVRESAQFVIRTQAQWEDLWHKHSSITKNASPAPAVDFEHEMVAAVFLGEKPTGGYAIEIVGAELIDRSLNILFRENAPAPGAIVTQAFTQPFHIVRIETHGIESVSFRRAP
jgi:hypothetical protein